MGKLFDEATRQSHLFQAWRRIRENGYGSSREETRWAVEQFDRQADRNLKKLQRRLRDGSFEFTPQIGIAKVKASGKGKRGIVMASVHNRIVERALLDELQQKVPFIKSVISMPTSVGGVPERSVPHGLKLIDDAIKTGSVHFVRSDISGFFDNIARKNVLQRIAAHTDDKEFLDILNRATTVTLVNEDALGEDRKIFPTDDQGVAQGSPLSPLFGNILLFDFDVNFNKNGIRCVRFIDDFILLSKDEWRVKKAFQSAKNQLEALGLKCHDPFTLASKEKAQMGAVSSGFTFLGYDIRPGLTQPGAKARSAILKSVDQRIKTGKKIIVQARREPSAENSQRYCQTLVGIDRALRGWGNAFSYGTSQATIEDLDIKIDKELGNFRSWYAELVKGLDWKARRRTGGVCLLSDIEPKNLSELPFRLEAGGRFVQSSKTVTISTDGSVIAGKRLGRDRGPGGWAYIVHETGEERSGSESNVTNNQMELRAVIEAVRATPKENSIRLRTDSQYVQQIIAGSNAANSNVSMWREYLEISKDRKIKIEWVKGHQGDKFNERADVLANQEAKLRKISQNQDISPDKLVPKKSA